MRLVMHRLPVTKNDFLSFYLLQANEFFFFAGLLVLVVIIFTVMAQFYTYVSDESRANTPTCEDDDKLLLDDTEDETAQ